MITRTAIVLAIVLGTVSSAQAAINPSDLNADDKYLGMGPNIPYLPWKQSAGLGNRSPRVAAAADVAGGQRPSSRSCISN